MRIILNLGKIVLGVVALIAVLHLAFRDSDQPPVRLVQVSGESMAPTLMPGERLLFIRGPWQMDSIVLADVGEDALVVKRVVQSIGDSVYLCGDNKVASETYWVPAEQIECVLLCRVPFRLPSAEAIANPHPEDQGEQLAEGW